MGRIRGVVIWAIKTRPLLSVSGELAACLVATMLRVGDENSALPQPSCGQEMVCLDMSDKVLGIG